MNEPKKQTNKRKSPLWKLSVRFFWQHFIFGISGFFVVTLFLSFFPEEKADLATALASLIVFFISLLALYAVGWHGGDMDRNMVNFGHITYQKYKGLAAGGLSLAPGLILCVLAMIQHTGKHLSVWLEATYKLWFAHYLWAFITLENTVVLIYLVPLLIVPPVCAFGYYCGYHLIYLKQKVMFQKPR